MQCKAARLAWETITWTLRWYRPGQVLRALSARWQSLDQMLILARRPWQRFQQKSDRPGFPSRKNTGFISLLCPFSIWGSVGKDQSPKHMPYPWPPPRARMNSSPLPGPLRSWRSCCLSGGRVHFPWYPGQWVPEGVAPMIGNPENNAVNTEKSRQLFTYYIVGRALPEESTWTGLQSTLSHLLNLWCGQITHPHL